MLGANAASAAIITIDFEEVSVPFEPEFSFKGFDFSSVSGRLISGGGFPVTVAWAPYGAMEMSRSDGTAFDLLSADLSSWVEGTPMTVIGNFVGGGTVQFDFVVAPGAPLETFNFGWTNLISVEFTTLNGPGVIDNVVVSAVPVPAAVWLFGSALAALGLRRRLQS